MIIKTFISNIQFKKYTTKISLYSTYSHWQDNVTIRLRKTQNYICLCCTTCRNCTCKISLSIQKKVAFAFGCKMKICLHYFATSSFVKNDNTGHYIVYKDGKKKTDHTDGRKVEIMVCDIQSYIMLCIICANLCQIRNNNILG